MKKEAKTELQMKMELVDRFVSVFEKLTPEQLNGLYWFVSAMAMMKKEE